MTLNEVREEMKKRGANKAQLGANTVEMVYGILSGVDISLMDVKHEYNCLKKECEEKRDIARRYEFNIDRLKEEHRNEQRLLKSIKDEVKYEKVAILNYISDFNNSLENCETKEARDKMRIAQIFINTVDVDSPQNNTAFIYGLSQILVGESFDIKAFKKTNERPKFDEGVKQRDDNRISFFE